MSERVEVTLPIREVTLLEDRVTTKRSGNVSLVAGRNRFELSGVSPLVVDSTLFAQAGHGTLTDARVVRRWRVRDAELSDEARRLYSAHWEAADARDAIQLRLEDETRALELVQSALERRTTEISEDVALGRAEPDAWQKAYADAEIDARGIRTALATLHHELQAAERLVADLQNRREAEQTPSDELICSVMFEIESDQAVDAAEVTLDVVVPGACWRPQHRATLRGGKLVVETEACIWQNTGEAWEDVQVFVSTERPSAGATPPELRTDWLKTHKKQSGTQVEVREQQVETTGLEGQPSSREASEVPGVDDGGQPWRTRATETTSVPSDGRPHRVLLRRFESEADVSNVVRAELATAVFTRVEARNESDVPLLAGPVQLVREHGPVGRSQIGFVAAGQKFELGFGPDPDFRVRRLLRVPPEDRAMLSGKVSAPHEVTVRISNLSSTPRDLAIRERVPVSEVAAVKVEVDMAKTTSSAKADRDGILSWNQTVTPHGQLEVRLRYVVTRARDVTGI